jgi:hypothetical protein
MALGRFADPCLKEVKSRKSRNEHMICALAQIPDMRLPPDQAAPFWREAQPQTAVFLSR